MNTALAELTQAHNAQVLHRIADVRAVSVMMEVTNRSTIDALQHIHSCVSYRQDGVSYGALSERAVVPVGETKATVTIRVDATRVDAPVVGGDGEFGIHSIAVDLSRMNWSRHSGSSGAAAFPA